MVLEVAQLEVTPGSEADFRSAYGKAKDLILAAEGVGAVRMTQGIESPSRFVLLVEWESVEAHNGFRASPAFTDWRALIGPHFASPPAVEHFSDVLDG